jgi:hypothetical protein
LKGFYINLDRDGGRREALLADLDRFGAGPRFERFPAVDGAHCGVSGGNLRPAEVGIFLSHHGILEKNRSSPCHLHIIEDDVRYSRHASDIIDHCVRGGLLDQYDVLYLDMSVPTDLDIIRMYKRIYDECTADAPDGSRVLKDVTVLPPERVAFSVAASYLVNGHSLDKLDGIGRDHIAQGIRRPYDMFLRDHIRAGDLRAACLFPFLTSVAPDCYQGEDVHGRFKNLSALRLGVLLRYSFFAGRDWPRCLGLLPAEWSCGIQDPHRNLIMAVLRHRLFGDYEHF